MTTGARVLQLSLDRPDPDALGGLAVHAAALSRAAPHDVAVMSAYPASGDLVVTEAGRVVASLPLGATEDEKARALTAAIVGTGATVLHVHSPQFGADALVSAVGETGVRLAIALHDHSLVCENYELLEGGSRYCDIPMDLERCNRCLASTRGERAMAVMEWRRTMRRLVDVADALVAPSRSVLELTLRVHPGVKSRGHPLPWGVPAPNVYRRDRATQPGPLRVAVVGVWAKVKGTGVLPALIAACAHLPVEWHLFGATEGASLKGVRGSARTVVAHGAYRRRALAERLVSAGCHLVVLPSVGAETFSLTLSEVVAAGFPVIASHLGALGERVRDHRVGWTFDPFSPDAFVRILSSLLGDREQIERCATRAGAIPHPSEEDMARDHAALWKRLTAEGLRPRGDTAQAVEHFREGIARAAGLRPSRFEPLLDFVKKTDFYRDLGLRRLVPESARKSLELLLRRPSAARTAPAPEKRRPEEPS